MLSGDRRRVVLLVATVVAALLVVGVAVALAKSQRDARRTLEERFVGGTGTAAALVQTIVGQAYASDAQIAERSLAGRVLRDADVRRVAPRLGGDSIVVIDASRRVIAGAPARATLAAGRDEHLRQALAGRPAISGALRLDSAHVVEVAVPYRSAAGRRVLVIATAVPQVQRVLGPYLQRIPGLGDRRAYILDGAHGGMTLADSKPAVPRDDALATSLRAAPPNATTTYDDGRHVLSSVAIPLTPWTLVRTTSAGELYSPVSGWSRDLPWTLLGVLVGAGALIVVLAERSSQTAKRARHANEAKSAFLASMSHELRTPMTTVMGFSEMLAAGRLGHLSDRQREVVGHIHTSSRHLNQLISEVLDLARVEEGRMQFAPEDVHPHLLVAEVVQSMSGLAEDRGVTLTTEAPDLGTRRLDPARFKQVLYNLVGNAIKFTEAGGRVTIRLRAEDAAGEIGLEVADTGTGIAAEDLDRIFLPFEQGVRGGGGAGLGLAISHRIVDAQGGRISVRSRPGDGSTFHVSLPAAAVQC